MKNKPQPRYRGAPLSEATVRILNLLAKKHTLKDVLNLGQELLGTPVAYNDPAYQHRGVCDGYPEWDIETRIKYSRTVSTERWIKEVLAPIDEHADNTPFVLSVEYNVDRLISKSIYAGMHIGHFTVPKVNVPLEQINPEVIKLLSDACAITYVLENSSFQMEPKEKHPFILFEALLRREWDHVRTIKYHSRIYYLSTQEHMRMLCVHSATEPSSLLKFEAMRLFQDHGYEAFSMVYEGRYAILITGSQSGAFEATLDHQLDALCIEHKMIMGVSDVFHDELLLADHYDTASMTVDAVLSQQKDGVHLFETYKPQLLFNGISQPVPLSMFLSADVVRLQQYDTQNTAFFLQTLRSYLEHARNLQFTADALGVHKNTVIYRLRRMEELFGLNLHDANRMFRIQISLYLLDSKDALYV